MVMCLRSTVARHQCIPRWIGIWYIKIDHQQLSNVYYKWINDNENDLDHVIEWKLWRQQIRMEVNHGKNHQEQVVAEYVSASRPTSNALMPHL